MPSSPAQLSPDELLEALYFAYDVLDRAMTPFVLLQKTAEDIVFDQDLTGNHIDIGICEQHLTRYGTSVIKQLAPSLVKSNDYYFFRHGEVPIRAKIIHERTRMFLYPDIRFYRAEQFFIPNPFDKYWKKKNLIK